MRKTIFFVVSTALLLISMVCSLKYGAVTSSWQQVLTSFGRFDAADQVHQLIQHLRMPRMLASVLVGSAFATAGALMQGVTNNPIADSGLLGINAGAGLGLALVFVFSQSPEPALTIGGSFIGAAIALAIVYLASNRIAFSRSPIRMVLLGAAISSFFSAISQSLTLIFNLKQDITFWFVGGTGNITASQVKAAAPIIALGLLLACLISRQVTLLSMGDEAAVSLGKNPQKIREKSLFCVLLLAGTAVSLVGTISFIGLIIPHIVRFFVGHDYRFVIPASALFGALFFVSADILARLVAPPLETPVGVLVTVIGVPLLLLQVRRGQL